MWTMKWKLHKSLCMLTWFSNKKCRKNKKKPTKVMFPFFLPWWHPIKLPWCLRWRWSFLCVTYIYYKDLFGENFYLSHTVITYTQKHTQTRICKFSITVELSFFQSLTKIKNKQTTPQFSLIKGVWRFRLSK